MNAFSSAISRWLMARAAAASTPAGAVRAASSARAERSSASAAVPSA
jgi:hypothetical protein